MMKHHARLTALRVATLASLLFGGGAIRLSLADQDTSPPVQAAAVPNDLAAITTGVDAIASAGTPGPLAVFGERAFVIACGKEDRSTLLPVAAAAQWEKGRVVALGHGGMLGADALKHEGTAKFVANAARWLAGAPASRIGVVNNDAMIEALNKAGFAAVKLKGKWHTALGDVGVAVVDSHGLDDQEIAALSSFVKNGGGLLTAGLGWGWLQTHPGKTIHDHPGNQLLRDAGLAWCDGTLDPTEAGAFTITPPLPLVRATDAMNALETAAASGAELQPQASATLISALRVLPDAHPLSARAAALLSHNTDKLFVSQSKPLRRKDGVARVLLSLQVELEKRTTPENIKAHEAAAAFPGAVPSDAPRVARKIEVDLNIPAWHSTGLYAAPGEVISITSIGNAAGCKVRIGCHTDHLWHHDKWSRVPDISREWSLSDGTTRVASAFGGLVYIDVPRRQDGLATFEIAGAVESPRFVLGKTSAAEWASSRAAAGPWGELESGKVIVSVPSASLRQLEDPAAVISFWDRISDAHATLATIPLEPDRPHRFVPDVQISAGYMHSGYPIMTHLDAVDDMTSATKLMSGTWGLLHELGHNHQQSDWTFGGTGEVTCNLFALHAIDTICSPKPGDRGHGAVNTPPSLEKYLAAGAKFEQWKSDPFLALHMYVQLEDAFGWETFKRVFAEYRDLPREQRPKNDDEKRDQWMVRFSRACGKNLGPFFVAWGVPTSEAARKSIADLPEWMPEGWPK